MKLLVTYILAELLTLRESGWAGICPELYRESWDPILSLFLSPDPFIQSPTYGQDYNRYSYALNNPLKYTDPSGYIDKPGDWNKRPTVLVPNFAEGFWPNNNGLNQDASGFINPAHYDPHAGKGVHYDDGNYYNNDGNIITYEQAMSHYSDYMTSIDLSGENGDASGTSGSTPGATDDDEMDDQNGGGEQKPTEEFQSTRGGTPVFGENNGGSNDWSGGSAFAQFGVSPYGQGTRGGNTEWNQTGLRLLADSWAFTLGGFSTFGSLPLGVNVLIWLYGGARVTEEIDKNKKGN